MPELRSESQQRDRRYYPRPRLVEELGGRDWEIIADVTARGEGIPSVSGALIHTGLLLRDRRTGELRVVGLGEWERYCQPNADFQF